MTVMADDIERELLQTVRQMRATRVAQVLDFARFLISVDPVPVNGEEQELSDWDKQVQQVDQEQRAYERQHKELLAQYRGRYVAMRHGKVIDHDIDRLALRRRIRKQYGNVPFFFTLVEDEPVQTFWMRSPHLVTDET